MTSAKDNTRPLKVAVIGGGICGLALAIGLQRAGLEIDLYEAAHKFGEIGAGIGIGSNALRVLKAMDLLEPVLEKIKPEVPDDRVYLILSGSEGHEIIYDYPIQAEHKGLSIHRAVFLDALVHLIDPSRVHFNKRCTGLKELPGSMMQLGFVDGTSAEADVVLGADGIRSNARTFVVGMEQGEDGDRCNMSGNAARVVRAAFMNTLAYRGLVPVQQAIEAGVKIDLSKRPHNFIGQGKHLIVFPIKDGTVLNIVAFTCDRSVPFGSATLPPGDHWVSQRTSAELLALFADFSADMRALLGCMEAPSAWAIHAVHPPLETYVRGRVALLGDAAHGMLPHLGAGAGQGLEDVRALVRLLAHPRTGRHNIEEILKAYDVLRRPRANSVAEGSLRSGEVYEMHGPHAAEGVEGIRKDLIGHWSFVWNYDLEAAIDETIGGLEARGVF